MKIGRLTIGMIAVAVLGIGFFCYLRANAAAVTLSITDGSGIVDGGPGGYTEITTTWTTSGLYATGTQIAFTISPAASSTITDCTAQDTQFAAAGDGSFGGFTESRAVYTLSQGAVTSTSGSLCLRFELGDTTPTNYQISMQASATTTSFSTTDNGAALYYVLGGNQVNVTASVPSSLSFSLRNAEDTDTTNVCQLGTLALDTVSFCSYRLRIATNAPSGFTATLQPNGPFNASGNATMTAILNDTAFATGTEAYGVAFLYGAASGGRIGADNFDGPATESGSAIDANLTFNADATPIDFTSATTVLSYTGPFNALGAPSLATTNLMVHGASVGAGTLYGSYGQTVTYQVTGSY